MSKMKVSLDGNEVHLECFGIEQVKIKTKLYSRLGQKVVANKDRIIFPACALPLVRDLLGTRIKSPEIESLLDQFDKHAEARKRVFRILEDGSFANITDKWRAQLDPAQSSAVSAMVVSGLLGLCLFDEQGSGKTVMTIAAYDLLKSMSSIDAMVVVCPKTMTTEWKSDIKRFLSDKYKISMAEGKKEEKFKIALESFEVLILNYEAAAQIEVPLAASAATNRFLLVVDESYYVKNTKSQRSEAIGKLRNSCARCFVLCGTPAPNSPLDLVNQFNLADNGYTFSEFLETKDQEANREQISDLVNRKGTFIRRLKSAIIKNVPKKNFHVVRLQLEGRQAKLYEEARSALELELRSLDNTMFRQRLSTYFQRRAALLQICSDSSDFDPTNTETPVKYKYLDRLLPELISQGRKVILWSFYTRSIDTMMNRYKVFAPVRVDGSVSIVKRRESIRLFQEDPEIMIFVGNPAAAGAGVTLHASYDAIYVSYSNQAAHYLQSLDRIHRRGQNSNDVNYYLLVCAETIEETEIRRLRGKELRQHRLLGDQISWPGSLDDALEELSGD